MDCSPRPVDSSSARKRVAHPEKWKRNVAKVQRYSAASAPVRPLCNHKKSFNCRSLTMADVKKFFDAFYKFQEKSKQDAFILKHCSVKPVQRNRPTNKKYKPKTSQISYFVYSTSLKKRLLVCQNFFLKVLQIKKYRVQTIMKEYFERGTLIKENRGGDRISQKNMHKKMEVMNFIEKLHCEEAHYCRGNTKRYYLSSELSINKLWKIYNAQAQENVKVKSSFFRTIFNRKYNLGFGTPRTDVCSICLQFGEKLKIESDVNTRNDLIIRQRIHKLKAKAFFSFLKDESTDNLILSFDCQKNLCLPKTPDQSAYYSRQINLFNFTIVQGSSKNNLTPSNVFAYCWPENSFPKASNQIASAVYHRLQNTNLTGINTVRLIADGCAGQNKNTTMLGMCAKWLTEAPSHIKTMELIFPIVGHLFIPPDRVFAQIEKQIRKKEIISNPNEYYKIIEQFSTVINMGNECKVFDWKSATAEVFKPVGRWHFKFKSSKRYILKRSKKAGNILIKGNVHYKHDDGVLKNVNKTGQLSCNINPNEIFATNFINAAKARDVRNLLTKHYGNDWESNESLRFFIPIVSGAQLEDDIVDDTQEPQEEHESLCEPQEPVSDYYV